MNQNSANSVQIGKENDLNTNSVASLSANGASLSKTLTATVGEKMTSSPHTLALLALLFISCTIQLILDFITDAFQIIPGFPIVPVVAMSCGLTFFSLILIVALGTHLIPQFHMFAPLQGGDYFCAMHLSGYALSIVSVILKIFLVSEFSGMKSRFGGMTLFGMMTVAGNFLLGTSILYYIMPNSDADHTDGPTNAPTFSSDPSHSPTKDGDSLSPLEGCVPSDNKRFPIFAQTVSFPPKSDGVTNEKNKYPYSPTSVNSEDGTDVWGLPEIAGGTALFAALLLSISLTESWATSRLAATLYLCVLSTFLCAGFFIVFRLSRRLQKRADRFTEATSSPLSSKVSSISNSSTMDCSSSGLSSKNTSSTFFGESENNASTRVYAPFRLYTESLTGGVAQILSYILLLITLFSIWRIFAIGPVEEGAIAWKFLSALCASGSVGLHNALLYLSNRQLSELVNIKSAPTTTNESPEKISSKSASSPSQRLPSRRSKAKSMRVPLLITIGAVFVYGMGQALYAVKIYWYYCEWSVGKGHTEKSVSDFFSLPFFSSLISFLSDRVSWDSIASSGVLSLQVLLTLLLFLLPPVTHCQGRLVLGRAFYLWNPFGGSRRFLIAQVVGWSSFGSAGLMLLLHLSRPRHIHFFFITSFLLFAQVCICISLYFFDPRKSKEGYHSAFRKLDEYSHTMLAKMTRSQRTSVVVQTMFNGELILSIILCVASFALRSICDVREMLTAYPETGSLDTFEGLSRSEIHIPDISLSNPLLYSRFSPEVLIPLANVVGLLSLPLAQFSVRHNIRLFFDIDRRSTGCVLLVAVGWTFYTLSAIALLINFVVRGELVLPISFNSKSSAPTDKFFLHYTCQGIVFLAPLVLLVCGFSFELENIIRTKVKKSAVSAAIDKLRKWGEAQLVKRASSPSASTKEEDQAKVEAEGDASLSDEMAIVTAEKSVFEPTTTTENEPKRIFSFCENVTTPPLIFEGSTHHREKKKDGGFQGIHFGEKAENRDEIPLTLSEEQKVFFTLVDQLQIEVLPGSLPTMRLEALQNGAGNKADLSSYSSLLGNSVASYERNDVDAVKDAAYYITILTSAGSSLVFLIAAILAQREHALLIPYTFAITGLVVMSFCCILLQYSYGHRLHDEVSRREKTQKHSRKRRNVPADSSVASSVGKPYFPYQFFLPFRGGGIFISLQGIGWFAFTFCWFFTLAMILEGRVLKGSFFILGFVSVVAQVVILISIGFYDGSMTVGNVFIARNPEGLLAAVTIVGTVCCTQIYDRAMSRHGSSALAPPTDIGDHPVSVGGASPVSVMLSSLACCVAVPIGILAVQRQRDQLPFPVFSSHSSHGSGKVPVGGKKKEGDDSQEEQLSVLDEEELVEEEIFEDCSYAADRNSLEGKPMQNAIWQAFFPSSARKEMGAGFSKAQVSLSSTTTSVSSSSSGKKSSERSPTTTDHADDVEKSDHENFGEESLENSAGQRPTKKSITHKRKMAYNFIFSLSRLLTIFLLYLIPFILFFLAYTYYFYNSTFEYGVVALKSVGLSLVVVLIVPTVLPLIIWYFIPVKNFLYAFSCAWFLWSISTIEVIFGLSAPFFLHPITGWIWFINMAIVSCFSVVPYIHLAVFLMNTGTVGYFFYYYGYLCWYTGRELLVPSHAAGGIFASLVWTYYSTRFFKKPHFTGRAYRPRARAFLRDTVFRGAALYFNLRVIKVKPYVLDKEKPFLEESERQNPPEVDRNDPSNQYLFSFHPHGIFPGTCLYGPCTTIWEDVVGKNDTNLVTTHAADIIFSVPFFREIPLLVGAMSVGRRVVQRSISSGNSPLIITGGQSEMLLSKWTRTELHLVCHHLGFIKLAMKNKIPLVPVISFSECNILDNVHHLRLQRYFLKVLGFPLLIIPHGFWYLPLPMHMPLALVVGQPLRPYPGRDDPDDSSCVEELRARYFNHLQTIFYRYRKEAGYPDMVLYLHNGIYDPGMRVPPPNEKKD